MRKIAVFTGTRAEYGLLYWILRELDRISGVQLHLYVGGTHLSHDYGYTISEIEEDGFDVYARLDFLTNNDSPVGVSESMSNALLQSAKAIADSQPDIIVLLGDRYESFAVAQAAMLANVPIAHIHGGELTEGAIDDAIRHAITKMSHLHFTATKQYADRVIQMGEQPDRVFNVGAPGLDNISKLTLMTRAELAESLGIDLKGNYFVVTFHPETIDNSSIEDLGNLLQALDSFKEYKLIITYPNADMKSLSLIETYKKFQQKQSDRVVLVQSLGQIRYLSCLKHCAAVIGNSSSGLIEAPSFQVPTINIGNRQKGRLCANSVLTCESSIDAIVNTIQQALSQGFADICLHTQNPYGGGNASESIVDKLQSFSLDKLIHKPFFNVDIQNSVNINQKKDVV